MKLLFFCVALLATGNAFGEEAMTVKRFKELVASPGDQQALRPELAAMPFWKKTITKLSTKYKDGKVFEEECAGTSKTVEGNYAVMSIDSKLYKQTMYTIVGYDEKALAVRQWGLFGDVLTQATVVFDPVNKVSASVGRYDGGFEEISAFAFSEKQISGRTVVSKDGAHFLTREAVTRLVDEKAGKEK